MQFTHAAKVYIPSSLYLNPTVKGHIRELVKVAGGSTFTEHHGVWHNEVTGQVVKEPITTCHVWYTEENPPTGRVKAKVTRLVAALLAAGEESVLVEWVRAGRWYAQLYPSKKTTEQDA